MVENNNIESEDYGFDNIDLSNNGSNGDDLNSRGGGKSRKYNSGGYEFDDDSSGGDDDFGVFNFCKGDDQPHATMPIPLADDEPRDAPPIQTFSIAEGLRQVPHKDTMVVANPTIDEVECHAPLLQECPQYHGHKGEPKVTPGTCGAIGERIQVILLWVRAPGRGIASHPQELGVTRVRSRALDGSWCLDFRMLKNTSIGGVSKKL